MEAAPEQHWYALKVFFNKVFELEGLLEDMGLETFLAVDKVRLKGPAYTLARKHIAEKEEKGKADRRYIQEGPILLQRIPMVSSLLFVKAFPDELPPLDTFLHQEFGKIKGYIYKKTDGLTYSAIPDKQMTAFRMVTAKGSEGLIFFSDQPAIPYKKGEKVRVKDGPLKGLEGYVVRIRRDRRLLVKLEGIIAVTTTHIPPESLESVTEEGSAQ